MSFLAIQHSQQEERLSHGDQHKDRHSFAEIQEEEKARREEENFLQWWQEEEARVKMEMEALEAFQQGGNLNGKQRKNTEGGRGRGKGGGGERSERGGHGRRGGGTRGEPKERKEGTQANQADILNFESQPMASSIISSQPQASDRSANTVMQSSASDQNHPRRRRYYKRSQKSPHHHDTSHSQ